MLCYREDDTVAVVDVVGGVMAAQWLLPPVEVAGGIAVTCGTENRTDVIDKVDVPHFRGIEGRRMNTLSFG